MATKFNRRQFLIGLATLGAAPWLVACSRQEGRSALLSSFKDADGRHFLCAFRTNGEMLWQTQVESRAHDVVVDAQGERAVFFGRRPGPQSWVLSVRDGRLLHRLSSPKQHHFNGHGALSADGQLVYSTETAYHPTRGMIGVWDIRNAKRVGEFPSGGLDPHECILRSKQQLVVANGGILTQPDNGRSKLNIPSMEPRLSYLDAHNGRLLREETLPNRQLSIRHLDPLHDGRIAVGFQYEGPKSDNVPLVAMAGKDRGLVPLSRASRSWRSFNQYVETVRVDANNQYLVVTGPKGGVMAAWDLASLQELGEYRLPDVSGLAATREGFIATCGLGLVRRLHPGQSMEPIASHLQMIWDNHAQEVDAWTFS